MLCLFFSILKLKAFQKLQNVTAYKTYSCFIYASLNIPKKNWEKTMLYKKDYKKSSALQ